MVPKQILLGLLSAILLGFNPILAQHTSPNYRIEESTVGPGGLLDAESSDYNLRASLGDLGVGNSSSTNFQLYGGYTTTDEEYLELFVNGTTVDLGVLSEASTAYGTATFYVRSFLANGYVVTTSGNPPTNSAGDMINAKSSQGAPIIGTEEFGINLKANTAPASFGAEAQQVPDSSFSFGYAAAGYSTVNQYKYANGDVIAQADSSSGQTTYTISYIANMNLLTTPAGLYTMAHSIVATSTF